MPSRLVVGRQVEVQRTPLERYTLASGCRSAWGSSCRTGCGGLTMERCTSGTMAGSFELAGTIAVVHMMVQLGSSGLAGRIVAHSRRCRTAGRMGSSGRAGSRLGRQRRRL